MSKDNKGDPAHLRCGVREDFFEEVTFRRRLEAGVEVSQGKAGGEERSRLF